MDIFSLVFFKVITLLISVSIGFVAGRVVNVQRDSVAALLFYVIAPIVFFNSISKTPINMETLSLPILVYMISSILCVMFYYWGKLYWSDATKNVLALSAGNGNAGYFGLPIAILLFNEEQVGIYMISIIGIILFENTLGFFITAKSQHDVRTSLIRVVKLPLLHAFFLGCIFSLLEIKIPSMFDDFMINVRGSYTILGMTLVGLGISSLDNVKLDFKFIAMSFLAKFFMWPLLVLLVILLDQNLWQWYSQDIYNILLLISFVPLAANTVVIASILKVYPEKAASAVVASMIFAAIYVPLMVMIFLK